MRNNCLHISDSLSLIICVRLIYSLFVLTWYAVCITRCISAVCKIIKIFIFNFLIILLFLIIIFKTLDSISSQPYFRRKKYAVYIINKYWLGSQSKNKGCNKYRLAYALHFRLSTKKSIVTFIYMELSLAFFAEYKNLKMYLIPQNSRFLKRWKRYIYK